MSVTVNYTSNGQPIPATNGIIGVPLPAANEMLGVNQAATNYQGYTLVAGNNVEIVYSDDARTITFNSVAGSGGTTTVSAGTGISVLHIGNDYAVSSTVVAPTVSAGTNVSVVHTGNNYAVSASGVQTITAGTNVTVSRVGDTVTVNATGGGSSLPLPSLAGVNGYITNMSVSGTGNNFIFQCNITGGMPVVNAGLVRFDYPSPLATTPIFSVFAASANTSNTHLFIDSDSSGLSQIILAAGAAITANAALFKWHIKVSL